ncbi:hypothetical protein [Clostridium perfringens]|uniref:hypothetical protein n=1 Tax=Clostridium perfringens TaxID=1502 RepID=UPI0013E3F17B|nr:hypothetical protein [Clostridium perfringens]MDK0795272.1 hypothetical protein [Clostridium perfringens]NGU66812.1 hypothetical protein [Clostridium perfringens]
MEGSKPKNNKKKITILISIVIIILIICRIIIYNTPLGYKLKVDYLLSYKKNHTAEETHQLLDRMFDINSKDNDEVYNIVFADEIQSTKKALESAKVAKEQEEIKQQNDMNSVTLIDLRQIPNSNEIEFKIDNPTKREIRYMEILINFSDENGNIITSDFTNEINIPGGTKRLKQTYVNPPSGTKSFNVTISKLSFEN